MPWVNGEFRYTVKILKAIAETIEESDIPQDIE